jgi:hypothetical protein
MYIKLLMGEGGRLMKNKIWYKRKLWFIHIQVITIV